MPPHTRTHTNHLLYKTRFLLSPTRVQQGVLHWVQLSSWKALVSPDVRHAGSQMSAFMSGVQSFVATAHRDVPPAPSIFKNFTGPLYFFSLHSHVVRRLPSTSTAPVLPAAHGGVGAVRQDGYISSTVVSKWFNISFVQNHIRCPRPTPL